MEAGLKTLNNLLDPYDWFYEACIDGGRYIVYVHHMGADQDPIIPDQMEGHQIVIHFASSKLITKEDFMVVPQSFVASKDFIDVTSVATHINDVKVINTSLLIRELDRLEKICGSNILGEIFFETHDKYNAVTNLSDKFPGVRKSIEKLYDEYGFNALYEELEL